MKIKTIYLQAVCILFLFSFSLTAQTVNGLPPIKSNKIKISIEKGENANEIVFKLTNEDNNIYYPLPIVSARNKISLTTEARKVIEHQLYVTPQHLIKVQPNETLIRKTDITSMLMMYKLTNEKNLRMIWYVNGVESNSIIINQRD